MNRTNTADVIIIGAGLTGLTIAYYLRKAGKKVVVVDKNPVVGGVIQTHREEGFLYESGPNTGIIGSPELVALFDDLSLRFEVPGTNAHARWIWKRGRWHALPSGLWTAITTPLFKWKDKFKVLGEPFRRRGTDPDESVADTVKRRLGKSFLRYAVDPFISGIYAGNPKKLITRYALPKLYALEQTYGSFVRGAIKKKRLPKTALEQRVTRSIFSVEGGLSNLIHALTEAIGAEHFRLNCAEVTVVRESAGYQCTYYQKTSEYQGNEQDADVRSFEQQHISATQLISTVDGKSVSELLPFLPEALVAPITALRYARVVQVVVGYKEWDGLPLKAFGGLVPSKEKENVLGILFPSAIFGGRAPGEGALLSIFMGGMLRPQMVTKSDEALRAIALKSVQKMLHSTREPDLLRIFRYERAIPQYEVSTAARLAAVEKISADYPGLVLAGNMRDGIGMSDRVKQGRQVAEELLGRTVE